MTISKNHLNDLAQLACLEINADESAHYCDDISRILDYVSQLQQVDTSQVSDQVQPHLASAQSAQSITRVDAVTESNQAQRLLKMATHTSKNYYLVPKVIES